MNTFLKNKNIIVTGASSGIGREISLLFAKNGANILAVARDENKLNALIKDNSKNVGKIVSFSIDLLRLGAAQQVISRAKSEFGRIDILINNAGIGYSEDFIKQEESKIDAVIKTNLSVPINLTKEVLFEFIDNKNGIIFFISSLAGKIGFPQLAPYSASKFGIEGFAETIREELRDKNIKIIVVRPGVTDTNFFNKAGMDEYHSYAKKKGNIHPASIVAQEIMKNIKNPPDVIIVGSDRIFLKILKFIPFKWRFKLLDFINLFN